MHISEVRSVKNGKKYRSTLIRESYRENGKVKKRTIANISKLPPEHVLQLKMSLKGMKGEFRLSDLETAGVREYGGLQLFSHWLRV